MFNNMRDKNKNYLINSLINNVKDSVKVVSQLLTFKSDDRFELDNTSLKDEELEDYVIQRQLNFSFVNTSDYYINHIKS